MGKTFFLPPHWHCPVVDGDIGLGHIIQDVKDPAGSLVNRAKGGFDEFYDDENTIKPRLRKETAPFPIGFRGENGGRDDGTFWVKLLNIAKLGAGAGKCSASSATYRADEARTEIIEPGEEYIRQRIKDIDREDFERDILGRKPVSQSIE